MTTFDFWLYQADISLQEVSKQTGIDLMRLENYRQKPILMTVNDAVLICRVFDEDIEIFLMKYILGLRPTSVFDNDPKIESVNNVKFPYVYEEGEIKLVSKGYYVTEKNNYANSTLIETQTDNSYRTRYAKKEIKIVLSKNKKNKSYAPTYYLNSHKQIPKYKKK